MGGWSKVYIEELHNLYSSPSQVKEYKIGGEYDTNGGRR
jgi:hypothetical protein